MKINEELLGFIWKYRKLPTTLFTTEGEPIQIISPGEKNTDAGPDFFGAKIQLGDTIWAGNVEIHVKSSDWAKHKHKGNPQYESIILHVVYDNDAPHLHVETKALATIELKSHLNNELLSRYEDLISSTSWIPCQNNLKLVEQMTIKPWLSKITEERLDQKTHEIRSILQQTTMDWETAFFIKLASCFGFKLNNAAFELLARSIPLKHLLRHSDNLQQVEALLFGQAGLLRNGFVDDYAKALYKEYLFLSHKYSLSPIDPMVWKFMRTRPGNFPTIRIAQFANILTIMKPLLTEMFGSASLSSLQKLLQVKTSTYWNTHYNFDRLAETHSVHAIGSSAIDNLIVNAIVPFVYLYGKFHNKSSFTEAAITMLKQISPEDNHIIRKWKTLKIVPENALESQALIELFNEYCSNKKCLFCSIGASLLLDVH